ncbi:DUF4261 domain-containing protein [Paenibacillus ehimensis]|uniref:DUF4261 domain-containing protein n=1 Tax=Paenibacillus ehimensis TaxID=79264 RepID=A0ABT8VGC4_9BACL|nr:DUF4261 domain-containing protein [Paenibacillus ehimensis]MDO3680023.1 DUF4261 domain-containing protein [Paenibacillus ehimensis]MEC0209746.1 DUF4261 domain-containing protein [Paenibacillus ehimensis]
MTEMEDRFEEDGTEQEAQDDSGFARVYMVELLYKTKPELSREALYAKMEAYTGHVDVPNDDAENEEDEAEAEDDQADVPGLAVWEAEASDPNNDTLMFFHLNYKVAYEEGEFPAQTCVFRANGETKPEKYEAAMQQAWHWPEARGTVEACRHSVLLTDFCAAGLPYKERLELFQNALRALLEVAPCDALYWSASDKLVEPEQYLGAVAEGQTLYGAMNVRFYNVQGRGTERREFLMDTTGLAALGLPDLQCHFYDMEPGEVASVLGDLGYYLYNRGDVIQDGETIGWTEQQRWRCEHQYALAEPRRYVLDLDPGEPYYAGRQHHDGNR